MARAFDAQATHPTQAKFEYAPGKEKVLYTLFCIYKMGAVAKTIISVFVNSTSIQFGPITMVKRFMWNK